MLVALILTLRSPPTCYTPCPQMEQGISPMECSVESDDEDDPALAGNSARNTTSNTAPLQQQTSPKVLTAGTAPAPAAPSAAIAAAAGAAMVAATGQQPANAAAAAAAAGKGRSGSGGRSRSRTERLEAARRYGWAQSWLELSVMPCFPETAGHACDLAKWFADPRVIVFNKVRLMLQQLGNVTAKLQVLWV